MRSQFTKASIDPLVIDPYWKQVPYAINFNDDSVVQNFGYATESVTQSATSSPQNEYSIVKWGSSSMYKPSGSGGSTAGYLQIGGAGATSYAIGSQDFTIECWFYFQTSGRGTTGTYNYGIFSLNTTSGTANKVWLLQYIGPNSAANKMNHAFYDGSTFTPAASYFPVQTWTHLSVCRKGSQLYSSINGVVSTTNTTSFNLTSITTGSRWGTNAAFENQYVAYFDDLRFTVGVARYTSNFNVPEKQNPIPTRPNN